MERKVRTYLANGGREVWLLYPRTKSVWIYRGKSAVETEGTLTSESLPEASIGLAEIFG